MISTELVTAEIINPGPAAFWVDTRYGSRPWGLIEGAFTEAERAVIEEYTHRLSNPGSQTPEAFGWMKKADAWFEACIGFTIGDLLAMGGRLNDLPSGQFQEV